MHDVKYFFLNKINQTIPGMGQKNFLGGTNYQKYYRKILFFKIQEGQLIDGGSAPA
jgi:hypothetical protein